jgi:hypothetical protein
MQAPVQQLVYLDDVSVCRSGVSTPEPFSTLWHCSRLCHNYPITRARERVIRTHSDTRPAQFCANLHCANFE